jgi:hypothetical protein
MLLSMTSMLSSCVTISSFVLLYIAMGGSHVVVGMKTPAKTGRRSTAAAAGRLLDGQSHSRHQLVSEILQHRLSLKLQMLTSSGRLCR